MRRPPVGKEPHKGRVRDVGDREEGHEQCSEWNRATAGDRARGGHDGTARVWSSDTGESICTIEAGPGDAVCFSSDGQLLLTGGHDRDIHLWAVDTAERTGTLSGHSGKVLSLALSSDGRYLVSGGEDGSVRVWDLNRLKQSSPAP